MEPQEVRQFLTVLKQPGKERNAAITICACWILGLLLLLLLEPVAVFFFVIVTVAVLICAIWYRIALFGIALTFPFINLEIVYGAINVPLVDLIGLIGVAGWIVRLGWNAIVDYKSAVASLRLPGIWFFLLFIIIALVSASQTWDVATSIKYVLRPLVFFYVVYVLYPVNVIRKKERLIYLIATIYGIGVLIAAYGFIGLAASSSGAIAERRIVPIDIFGLNPLGASHNLIADVMIAVIPIGFFLLVYAKQQRNQKLLFIGLAAMIMANLFTFSRTGWIGLLVELALLIILQYNHHLRTVLKYTLSSLFVAIPLIAYMFFFSIQAEVQSSNENRILLNDIAWEMFTEHPWIGAGPGTFQSHVMENSIYMEEYGSPLDAHGFIQKVGSELGVLGLLSYFALLVYVIIIIYRGYRNYSANTMWSYLMVSVLIAAAGSIVFQLFQTSYFVAKLWFPLGIALTAVYIAQAEQNRNSNSSHETA